MTQTLTKPDPRFVCDPGCEECLACPRHQNEAYLIGVAYGLNYRPVDLGRAIAYAKQRVVEADRLAKAFVCGIYDGLVKQAEAVTA